MESDDPFDVVAEPPVPSRTDDPFDIFDAPPAEEGAGGGARRPEPAPAAPQPPRREGGLLKAKAGAGEPLSEWLDAVAQANRRPPAAAQLPGGATGSHRQLAPLIVARWSGPRAQHQEGFAGMQRG